MNKMDFQKKFPDVKIQQMETKCVLSRAAVEKSVIGLVGALDTGLIYYEYDSKSIKIFTSDKMKVKLEKMVYGCEVLNPHTGKIGRIISEKPYVLSCQMCVTVDFDGNTDAFDCEFFI